MGNLAYCRRKLFEIITSLFSKLARTLGLCKHAYFPLPRILRLIKIQHWFLDLWLYRRMLIERTGLLLAAEQGNWAEIQTILRLVFRQPFLPKSRQNNRWQCLSFSQWLEFGTENLMGRSHGLHRPPDNSRAALILSGVLILGKSMILFGQQDF